MQVCPPKFWILKALALLASLLLSQGALIAGVYYSQESYNELPSQWRGLLMDQRQLRQLAVEPKPKQISSEFRKKYLQDLSRLDKLSKERKLLPEEFADQGALLIRLNQAPLALETLRKADREYPLNFRILANLSSAWQTLGEFDRAIQVSEQAIALAPGKYVDAEKLQLFWIKQLKKQKAGQKTDNLFNLQFQSLEGKYIPGGIDPAQLKTIPKDAIASVQLLALWFPADSLLLMQLAEIANASGDPEVALAMMDGCVTEFGLREGLLLEHRRILKEYVQGRKTVKDEKHQDHKSWFVPKSLRPFALDKMELDLPPIKANAVNLLPWLVLAQTQVDRKALAQYPAYLKQLENQKVQIEGHMQPVGEENESSTFLLLENPVGCWYCEMPSLNGMVLIELKDLKVVRMSRQTQIIKGKLQLRKDDPEKFLFTILEAEMHQAP
ncbi:hypothetical protein EBS67_11080 [bacterium]|nr:hypothetical protein [bacterium]